MKGKGWPEENKGTWAGSYAVGMNSAIDYI